MVGMRRKAADSSRRFNSLLIAAFPPELPSGLAPVSLVIRDETLLTDEQHIVLQPGEYLGLLFLGSDGEIRFKAASSTNKRFGALKYQHGDVIGVKAGVHPIEIVLKPEDFGFGTSLTGSRSCGPEADLKCASDG